MAKIGPPPNCDRREYSEAALRAQSISSKGTLPRSPPISPISSKNPITTRSVAPGLCKQASPDRTLINMNVGTTPSPQANDGPSVGVEAVHDLLASMRLRLSLVGQEINVIGSETVRLGVLTNANDTAEKIQALRSELDLRDSDRSSQIEELKGELRNVLEQRVRSALEGVIRQTIANNSGLRERVAQQIASQIPVSLLTQLRKSKLLLQQIQMDLYNSEARRQNAAIHGHSLTEPIRPLLRPLAMPLTSPTNGMVVPVTPAQPAPPPVTPATPHQRVSSISSASSFESNSSTMSWEIEAPTPSDRFPRDLREFASLDDETLHSLLFDYRLESQEDRLKDMNAFLTHINVPFQVTPVSAHPGKSGKPQVVFTAAH